MKSNKRSCRCFQVVNIHKFWVYKIISRPKVNKSLEWNFIKVILTKNQERSKKNKKQMWIRKSRCIESDRTHCYIRNFNMALNLYGVLRIVLYFSKGFSKVAVGELIVTEAL